MPKRTYNTHHPKDHKKHDNSESWDIESGHFFRASRMGYNLRMLRRIQMENMAAIIIFQTPLWQIFAVDLGLSSKFADVTQNKTIFEKINDFFNNISGAKTGLKLSSADISDQSESIAAAAPSSLSANIGKVFKRATQSISGISRNCQIKAGAFLNHKFASATSKAGGLTLLPAYAEASAPDELSHSRQMALGHDQASLVPAPEFG